MPGKRIVFIGAGSFTFTRNLVRDILTFPALADATLVLVDVNDDKLAFARAAAQKIVDAGGYPATVVATKDRDEALRGADAVLTTIAVGNALPDVEIPKRYGVSINVGDTRGPSGIFRFLRTWPVMRAILSDIERLCPGAIFLNYVNPMAMLCRAMQADTKVQLTGLCHSVQGTAEMLARWIGAPMSEVTYLCAGINHQAFYLDYRWKGQDAYPLLREAVLREEVYNEEQVRNEMFIHLGYFPTESSGHNSEYNAWFRKRPDLLEKYCTHGTGWNPGLYGPDWWGKGGSRNDQAQQWLSPETKVELARGHEYAAYILNATVGDGTLFEFNGNVRNFGLIDNLPEGCCVEVPVVASPRGLSAMHVGPLPANLALLTNTSARCEELAVEAALTGDPEPVYQAAYFDPLVSAMLSLSEIRAMVNEMFEANAPYLGYMKHRS